MQTFLDKALMPIVLLGCVLYVFSEYDAEPPAQDAPPVIFAPAPVVVIEDRDREPVADRNQGPRLQFAEYPCGDDCSEHVAGYDWARDSGISDPDNCEGRSAPFIEGCRVFVEEKAIAVALGN
jgi:hypothetical protein